MRLFNFASVKLSLCLSCGILIAHLFKPALIPVFCCFVLLLVLLGIVLRYQKRKGFPIFSIVAFLTIAVLGTLTYSLNQPKNYHSHYSFQDIRGFKQYQIKIREVLKPTPYASRYIAGVNGINGVRTTGTILLTIPKDSINQPFYVDETLLGLGKVKEISAPLNLHEFDYRTYMQNKGIYHQLQFNDISNIVTKTKQSTLKGYAASFRKKLIAKLQKQGFGQQELGVIQALLLGQRNDIDNTTYDDYKNAGAVHILAVSGLHIGIFLLILQFVLAPLKRLRFGKQLKIALIIAILWAFAFVAGLSPSVVRAVTMFSFVAYAMQLNRPTSTFNIIALSFFSILLVSPSYLFQVGFQMSYAAVFAIVWLYPILQRFYLPKNKVLKKVWQLLAVSCAAQLGVLPISLFYFHQFPSLFFISNLLIVPFLGLILGLGLLVILLTALGQIPQILVSFYNALIGWMNAIVHWVAAQEDFIFQKVSFDAFQLILAYGFIVSFVTLLKKPSFRPIAICLALSSLYIGHLSYLDYRQNKTDQLIIAHQIKHTVLVHHQKHMAQVFHSQNARLDYVLDNYTIAERIDSVTNDTLSNVYRLNHLDLYLIDSLGILPQTKKVDYLLLTQSPKINLSRLLDSVQPKQIIADGSNYKSDINRWQASCANKKIPFHYTGEKGAFVIQLR